MTFQKTLNRDIPRGVAGDFASTNPRNSMLAGEGALVAGEPILVGQFAFADTATGKVYAEHATGYRVGFVHRNNQAVVNPGQSASFTVPTGKEVTLFTSGDFYAIAPATVAVGDLVGAGDDGEVVVGVAPDPNAEPAVVGNLTGFVFAEAGAADALVKITTDSI